ncbi:MAG: hypothetical protein ABFR05_04260 [Bacteroidota bacterium]
MKIYKLLVFVFALSLGFSSCNNDDTISDINLISKKFETVSVKINKKGEQPIDMNFNSIEDLKANDMYSVTEFKSDKRIFMDGEDIGIWSKNGSTFTISEYEGRSFIGIQKGDKITIISQFDDTIIEMQLSEI